MTVNSGRAVLLRYALLAATMNAPAASQTPAAPPAPPKPSELIVRAFPDYTKACKPTAKAHDSVTVAFDLSPGGAPENLAVIASSNGCLEKAAMRSVAASVYAPARSESDPASKRGQAATVEFEWGRGSLPERSSGAVTRKLRRVRRMIAPPDFDAAAAIVELHAIETKHGASMTPRDRADFHAARFSARVLVKDHRGALDDLRAQGRLGVPIDYAAGLAETIRSLEAWVAIQNADVNRTE